MNWLVPKGPQAVQRVESRLAPGGLFGKPAHRVISGLKDAEKAAASSSGVRPAMHKTGLLLIHSSFFRALERRGSAGETAQGCNL
jgi:hypothetical protein